LNGRAVAGLLQPVIDKWLEQLQSHLLRQSALVQLELRTDYDNGAARVIHAFTQQVLAKSALLAFQRVRDRLYGTIVRATPHAAKATVIGELIECFVNQAII